MPPLAPARRNPSARNNKPRAARAKQEMHPPLYKAHPLCQPEVEELVRCHSEKPVLKFFGACNDAKHWLDTCFREEKKLRKSLNPRVSGAEWVKAAPGRAVDAPTPPAAAGAAGGK